MYVLVVSPDGLHEDKGTPSVLCCLSGTNGRNDTCLHQALQEILHAGLAQLVDARQLTIWPCEILDALSPVGRARLRDEIATYDSLNTSEQS